MEAASWPPNARELTRSYPFVMQLTKNKYKQCKHPPKKNYLDPITI